MTPEPWFVYMIRTEGDRLYPGIPTDPERRFREHEDGRGAKFFRLDPPGTMVFLQRCPDRASATRRELEIKRMSRSEKLALAAAEPPHA